MWFGCPREVGQPLLGAGGQLKVQQGPNHDPGSEQGSDASVDARGARGSR